VNLRGVSPHGLKLLAALAGVALAMFVGATPARSAAAAGGSPSFRLTRRDAAFAAVAAGAVALAATQDRRWSAGATADRSRFALDLAADARRLGDPYYVGAALVATDGLARLARREPVAAASERIGLSVAAAGVVAFTLKQSIGRWRPDEASDQPGRFDPFSKHDSFPSGHTTLAFALVSALDAETRARWVPAVGYPAAALTAWSRVRDHRHWPSDVIAGAAIGHWIARKADVYAQHRWPRGLAVDVLPHDGGAELTVSKRF
jgi:membrane-associated phospholipid phosphatase